jgi:FMN-dependent NADH-azoreductase
MKILHIDSSPRGVGDSLAVKHRSVSRMLTKEFILRWQQTHPGDEVVYRDLASSPVPLVDEAWIAAAFSDSAESSPALQVSNELIDEIIACDRFVFGIPMYNFTVPASFKAYIDQIVRIGRTFSADYEGLISGKKMLVITARGDSYAPGTPTHEEDFQEPYLRRIFGFIGIEDIVFIHAEKLTLGDEERQQALTDARAEIEKLVVSW